MLDFVLRAMGMYFLALLMIRLLGKRALGELGPFDFVVMTGVGHTVVAVALDKSLPFWEGIVILATLAGLESLIGFLALKNGKLSDIITGKPVVLIDKGKIVKENLAKERFNVDDLMQELRKQGVRDISEVDKGILESCGGFSVIFNPADEPVSLRDLGIIPKLEGEFPTAELMTRREIFQRQQENFGAEQEFITMSERLKCIEEKLDHLLTRIEQMEDH